MKPYKNLSEDSGITEYEYGNDWITIRWHEFLYRYELTKIGYEHLTAMKRLADDGDELNTYINKHPEVKSGYSSKHHN
jgi:hypothetical protein